ncbi:hypothetical protein HK096_004276 [Nowakowskiella sp. JEL0078]|nr:hypothetical protein HK096_004276 [Nowakowskiella sp. JEL0078]
MPSAGRRARASASNELSDFDDEETALLSNNKSMRKSHFRNCKFLSFSLFSILCLASLLFNSLYVSHNSISEEEFKHGLDVCDAFSKSGVQVRSLLTFN